MGVYTTQLFVANWQKHGSILGSNEIIKDFMNRDLIVFGLSDGIMCGSTGFGLILQKLIQYGYLSWNKEGWIIQSVSWTQIRFPVIKFPSITKRYMYSFTTIHTIVSYFLKGQKSRADHNLGMGIVLH